MIVCRYTWGRLLGISGNALKTPRRKAKKMLFDTYSTQAAEASLDSLWLKTQVITNNLANVDTPNFKASNVTFEEVLSNASRQKNKEGKELAGRDTEGARGGGKFQTRVTQDVWSSVRVDGNNVQLEQQQSELWKTYAQYSYLLDRISGHYGAINTAINGMKG
ncbi:flagellar basal body rod protein FlgB [Ruminococcaceae bacterium OttesenSCG-928-A11]|nr:flagellar basal body rod protein FlgB [Ruminococcaceae bacterium OttesenSCG-928-A11]